MLLTGEAGGSLRHSGQLLNKCTDLETSAGRLLIATVMATKSDRHGLVFLHWSLSEQSAGIIFRPAGSFFIVKY